MNSEIVNEIREAIVLSGGTASLTDIYQLIERRNLVDLSMYVDPHSVIRNHLYQHSSDCDIFKGTPGDQSDLFYSVTGKGKGIWGLRRK